MRTFLLRLLVPLMTVSALVMAGCGEPPDNQTGIKTGSGIQAAPLTAPTPSASPTRTRRAGGSQPPRPVAVTPSKTRTATPRPTPKPVTPVKPTARAPRGVDILVYGDSLTAQSINSVGLGAPGKTIVVHALGGTAPCDWVPLMPQDRATLHPKVVVMAFVGNAATPCIKSAFTAAGVSGALWNYQAALHATRRAFPQEHIVVLGGIAVQPVVPAFWANIFFGADARLNQTYRWVAADIGATFDDYANLALAPGHAFQWQRPPFPCVVATGACSLIPMRGPDGIHLTPGGTYWYGWALTKRAGMLVN